MIPALALLLLALAATVSGAEAALFSWSARPPAMRPALVQRLLRDSVAVLTLILIVNLVANLGYFAAVALWTHALPARAAAAWNAAAIGVIVLFGEILPKLFGNRASALGARLFLPPVAALHAAAGPLARALSRRLVAAAPPAPALDSAGADVLVAAIPEILGPEERVLLRRILELGQLRAGALRRPLRPEELIPQDLPLAEAEQRLQQSGLAWGAVVEAGGEVRGILDRTRRLTGARARDVMLPVPVLPELAPVAAGIRLLRASRAPFVLLVDEFGQAAGIIERGRWADTLLNRLPEKPTGRLPAVVPLGRGRFRVDASLPLHEFRERFGDPGPLGVRVDTVGGLVQAVMGRVPRIGERVHLGRFYSGLDLVVTRADSARVLELELRQTPANNGTPYSHPRAGTE